MENDEHKIKKSLKYSIFDGSFYAGTIGFGESFFSAFAVFLKATSLQLGILSSLPQLLGSLSELYSNKLLKLYKSRQKIVSISALLQGLILIPIILVFFLGGFKIYYLILFVSLYYIFGMILGPAWNSWMGDLVDRNSMGAYFGKRNKIINLTTFVTFVLGGLILQYYADSSAKQYLGFVSIFLLAALARLISYIFLTKKYEPKFELVPEAEFSLLQFIKEASHRNYGRFVLYLCFMNFAVYIASPYFTPFMLNDLKLSYLTYTTIAAVPIIVKFLTMPIWGRLCDKHGTLKVLTLSGFMMPLFPIFWAFSKNIYYLMILEAYSGFVWAGFDLASFNYIFDSTTPQKRPVCVAYLHVLKGFAIFLGSLTGAIIISFSRLFWSKYLMVFIITTIVRIIVSIIFLPKLKEVRPVEPVSYRVLLQKALTVTTTAGIVSTLVTFSKNHINNINTHLLKKSRHDEKDKKNNKDKIDNNNLSEKNNNKPGNPSE